MKKLPNTMAWRLFTLMSGLLLTLSSTSVTANETQNLIIMRLTEGAESYVRSALPDVDGGQLDVSAMSVDPRIDVPACQQGFTYSASAEALQQSLVTVRAECPDAQWYLYLMVKTAHMQPVVVLNSAVSPNTVLTAAHLDVIQMDKKQLRTSTFADIEEVIGARIKRRTRPGQPVQPNQLCFVCKGDSISISANAGGLQIKTSGIAQQDGNVGDTIRVMNSQSNKTIRAQVVDTNLVTVSI
ncbi:flagellar basal body P-ring formation protein FlgA [Aestuariibacter halophilus]|uniref:Flagella basal body P-ring formation protein FlgA n=1 Tax=Fluctibacter halophilus TaxID=226011 RepID=A0ABS8G3L1_9ALTE|nr:flagellar basal body P-ring formation chaperone FlgA [Aestuariibacter halophilus]MCC2615079.1 flagellar basal body P-ring formation protein FlgA [Aestuariibacter halophilus]